MIVTTTDVVHKAVLRAYLAIITAEVVLSSRALWFFLMELGRLSADGMAVIYL
ncbi:hypothetical protein NDI44_08920 [Trichocoleus sp. DQ-A3]|uniref:hypothetical protein n=1 Tax=Coleofasciculus sp. FACHB-125 TaxID=2692784 RepID=UPI001F553204|nr:MULTISPECIES: hypothetical protein [unclassified Coleofasciculus]